MTKTEELYNEFGQALIASRKNTIDIAEKVYQLMDHLVSKGATPHKASLDLREYAASIGHNIMVGKDRIRTYYEVCGWLIQQTGGLNWVGDRSFEQHLVCKGKRKPIEYLKEGKITKVRIAGDDKEGMALLSVIRGFITGLTNSNEHVALTAKQATGSRKAKYTEIENHLEAALPHLADVIDTMDKR